MRYTDSIFASLLKPLDRRRFHGIVEQWNGDAYDKSFKSWAHLVALIFAQLSHVDSLRGLVATFNANAHHHYHLGVRALSRSTLSDANARRPAGVFADTFTMLSEIADRQTRQEGAEVLRLIDSSPIPLGKMCDWATWNGRIRGMKMHVIYDPNVDCPRILDITDANVNDAQIGRTIAIETGATYVFDKGYCHYGWWSALAQAEAFFVTRPKSNMGLKVQCNRRLVQTQGDGFTVLDDAQVSLASKGDSKLPIPLRRLLVQRQDGDTITLLTNDLERSAVEIAALYKGRWQIELLFRWIKQHLKIRKFLGNNDNAIRLQLFAAMIAYALLRIAARACRIAMPILRFTNLVTQYLFERRTIQAINKPPPVNPSRRMDRTSPNQLHLAYE